MVSVIAVNHNSSALLKDCLSSIVSANGNEPLEFMVIDSGSREDDLRNLLALQSNNVKIILNKENIGYAKAINIGVRNAQGEIILITNPDVLYQPGSIGAMTQALELPRCGAIGPRIWWNKEMTFLLPISEMITPYMIFTKEIMKVSAVIRKIILRGWVKKNLRYWLSDTPLRQKMLSGACMMTRRDVLDVVGGFDETFPLYFEDTDWCLRVRKAGYRLYMLPQARVIHYYNQSAKQDAGAAIKKFDYSQDLYLRKHFKTQFIILREILKLLLNSKKPSELLKDIGVIESPPVFYFQDDSEKLFLLSPVESLIPSAGSFFKGKTFKIPEDLWGCLGDGTFFAMAFDLSLSKNHGAWNWIKRHS